MLAIPLALSPGGFKNWNSGQFWKAVGIGAISGAATGGIGNAFGPVQQVKRISQLTLLTYKLLCFVPLKKFTPLLVFSSLAVVGIYDQHLVRWKKWICFHQHPLPPLLLFGV
ncbi:hypothetical protein [Mucilaginibacter sp. HD30]